MTETETVKCQTMLHPTDWGLILCRGGQKVGSQWLMHHLTQTEQRYRQVEKEALGLTWTCERFKDFLIGKHFELETDHKPVLSLLGSQALDALPPRIQRFKM